MSFIKINKGLIIISFIIIVFVIVRPISCYGEDPKSIYDALRERITKLEVAQQFIIDSSSKGLEKVYLIFAIVSVFFGIFIIFNAIRSFFDSKRRNRLEDQHMNSLQAMMGSFRDNINTINSLITSLRQTFDFQADISKSINVIDERIKELDKFKQHEQISYRSQVDSLNRKCSEVFKKCALHKRDRDSFKVEENRIVLQSLSSHFDTLEITGDINQIISPVSLFLRGLSRFNSMHYEEALFDFQSVRDKAKQQLKSPLEQYGNWDTDEIKNNLRVLLDETYYHIGIIFYNIGDWENSKNEFLSAHERFPLDFRSRIYIPEIMFFDNTSDPRKTENEYNSVELEMENVTSEVRGKMNPSWEISFSSLKMRQGNFYIKKLFPPRERGSIWSDYENNQKSIECYSIAKDKVPESAFITFSLAQALEYENSTWNEFTSTELFSEAFYQFRNMTILKTEPILLTLLFYCTAISCFYGDIPSDNAYTYLGSSRQHLQRVPKTIRVFSPINKISLDHEQFLYEMDQLEKWWQGR